MEKSSGRPHFPSDIEQAINNAIVKSAVEYAIIALDGEALVMRWNKGAENILGWTESEMIGQTLAKMFTEEDHRAHVPAQELETTLRVGRSKDERWHLKKSGARFWASGLMLPLISQDSDDQIGFLKIIRDRTKLREFMDREQLLKTELAHRTKNILAIVQALARQSFSSADKAALDAFQGRLKALDLAQNVLFTEEESLGGSFQALVLGILRRLSVRRDCVIISGDNPWFDRYKGLALALAFHELATNAIKYGSLSTSTGTVTINCFNGPYGLQIEWVEAGGPRVSAPKRRGAGSRLIQNNLAAAFHGEVTVEFEDKGLRMQLVAPAERAVENRV